MLLSDTNLPKHQICSIKDVAKLTNRAKQVVLCVRLTLDKLIENWEDG